MQGNEAGSARSGRSASVRTALLVGAIAVSGAGGIAIGAVVAAKGAPAPQSLFVQHAQQAGIKACANAFPMLGDTLTNGASYAAETTWNKQAPDGHSIQSIVGMSYATPKYKAQAAGLIFASPVAGHCEGNMVRVAPFAQSCAEVAKTLSSGSTLARTLSGTPLYNLGGNSGQAALLSTGTGCTVISVVRTGWAQ